MRQHFKTFATFFAVLLTYGCAGMDEMPDNSLAGHSPILLSTGSVERAARVAKPDGMHNDFKVYAAFRQAGTPTEVMNGYAVTYNGSFWDYESPSQPLQFWKRDADDYLFTAGAPVANVEAIDLQSLTLHMQHNLTASDLYSHPLRIGAADPEFGKTVNLHFAYAHCRVGVAFIKDSETDVTLSGIRLTPSAPVTSEAYMTFTFDWNTLTASPSLLTPIATDGSPLAFDPVTIPKNTATAQASATRHYCIPDASNPTGWTVSLTCDGENKSASFVNEHTWESGKNYLYVFSLTANVPKLVKVIVQDDYFDCNDIGSGGSFSDTDMTE